MKSIIQGLKPFLALVALFAGYTLSGCSDTVDSSTDGTARVEAEMSGTALVSRTLRDDGAQPTTLRTRRAASP